MDKLRSISHKLNPDSPDVITIKVTYRNSSGDEYDYVIATPDNAKLFIKDVEWFAIHAGELPKL